jgi:transcription elongation GreA/GreB family factor
MIGKELNDAVTVQSPKGKREYEVTKIEWLDVAALDEEPPT